jgi:hypothetical protein
MIRRPPFSFSTRSWCGALVCASLLLGSASAVADVPELFPLQGVLRTIDGDRVEGDRQVHFALYRDATAATPIWSETQTVTFRGGLFTAYLGASERLPLDLVAVGGELYAGIRIDGDDEMPRVRIATHAFAALAGRARRADLADQATDAVAAQTAETAAFAEQAEMADDAALLQGRTGDQWLASAVAAAEASLSTPSWTDLQDVPPGFADGIDNDTLADVACVPGQWLRRAPDAWVCDALPVPSWDSLTGIPAGFADGVDNDTLASLACADGQLVRRASGAWQCGAETPAPVRSVSAGTGLSATTTDGDVVVSARTDVLQARVHGACAAGSSIREIRGDGTVVCQTDTNTNCSTSGTCTQVCIGSDCRTSWPSAMPVVESVSGTVTYANNTGNGAVYTYNSARTSPISLTVALEADGSFNRGSYWEARWLLADGTVTRDWTVLSGTNIRSGGDGGSGMADAELATVPFVGGATRIDFRKMGNNAAALRLVALTWAP